MEKNNEEAPIPIIKKLILVGLDNAGKTSILLSLRGIKNLSEFTSVTPTRGMDKENFKAFGSEYSIMDLGGQEAYRDTHLENLKRDIKGTNKIIYVIDVQDIARYDMAIEFLERVVHVILENRVMADFSIFLHKSDPDLYKQNKNINDSVIKDLTLKIKAALPDTFSYTLQKTSIYPIFEKLKIE